MEGNPSVWEGETQKQLLDIPWPCRPMNNARPGHSSSVLPAAGAQLSLLFVKRPGVENFAKVTPLTICTITSSTDLKTGKIWERWPPSSKQVFPSRIHFPWSGSDGWSTQTPVPWGEGGAVPGDLAGTGPAWLTTPGALRDPATNTQPKEAVAVASWVCQTRRVLGPTQTEWTESTF